MAKSDFIGKYCSASTIDRLIAQGGAIRSAMYDNPAWTNAHTDAAANSKHEGVRMTMAHFGWDKLNEGHRHALLNDPNPYVRSSALYAHLSAKSGDELVKFIHDPANVEHHETAYDAGANGNRFEARHLNMLTGHPNPKIRRQADRELFDRGSHDY
jgi:hypothetical protein